LCIRVDEFIYHQLDRIIAFNISREALLTERDPEPPGERLFDSMDRDFKHGAYEVVGAFIVARAAASICKPLFGGMAI
jgi:hypothetical protein